MHHYSSACTESTRSSLSTEPLTQPLLLKLLQSTNLSMSLAHFTVTILFAYDFSTWQCVFVRSRRAVGGASPPTAVAAVTCKEHVHPQHSSLRIYWIAHVIYYLQQEWGNRRTLSSQPIIATLMSPNLLCVSQTICCKSGTNTREISPPACRIRWWSMISAMSIHYKAQTHMYVICMNYMHIKAHNIDPSATSSSLLPMPSFLGCLSWIW